ncbi:MAG: hypothetical protein ISS53_06185 [Dehalococcoidia bacterium]|nr:hypothetical protein [Dehalococcoidia bacterium]
MSGRISIVYNEPVPETYHSIGEGEAVAGVLDSVAAVREALEQLRYEVLTVPLEPPLALARARLKRLDGDMVFNLFEGFNGPPESEADFAVILEEAGLCFTGSPSWALLLCQDKSLAKQVLRVCGIPTPDWQVITPETLDDFTLSLPCIVKPLGEHASHGISEKSVVGDLAALEKQVRSIYRIYDRPSMVEVFVPGREFCALVVGNRCPEVFPVEEIVYDLPPDRPRILTYSAKWVDEDVYSKGTTPVCPAEVEPRLAQSIRALALNSFVALGCRGYARVDIRQDEEGQLKVLDVNPNPDISPRAGAVLQAAAAGMDHVTFVSRILSLAKERFGFLSWRF